MEDDVPSAAFEAVMSGSRRGSHRDQIVRAGAGAGKTYTLTHQVMKCAESFLAVEGRLPKLVVTTFTRKATQELRERMIRLALEERPELIDFVNSRSLLVISTMHGVMDLYLKRYGLRLSVDPGYRVLSAQEATKMARQTLRAVLFENQSRSLMAAELLEDLSFNTMLQRLRRVSGILLENPGARPFSFDDFAAFQTQEIAQIANRIDEAAARIRAETNNEKWLEVAQVHAEMARLLRSTSSDPIRAQEIVARVQALADDLSMPRAKSKGTEIVGDETVKWVKAARENLCELSEPLHNPELWRRLTDRYVEFDDLAREFTERFENMKRERGLLEISDLERLALKCLRDFPETAKAFAQEWDHWFIDEYQDTSPLQVSLIKALSGDRPHFIVGDPQQSIYLFRGSRSEVFERREREIAESGGTTRFLKVNRRSQPELLLFLNDLFTRLNPPFAPMEPFLEPRQERGEDLDANRIVAKIVIIKDSKDKAKDNAQDPSQSSELDAELLALVVHVQGLLASGAKPEEICVLGRTNQTLSEVAEVLSRFHLPTHVHAARGFYDRREIRDALALLKFLVQPHDNENTYELLRSPWFKVPDFVLIENTRGKPESFWRSLVDARSMSDEHEAVRRLKACLDASERWGLSFAFEQSLVGAGLIDLAHEHDVSGRRESNLWKLLVQLRQEEIKPGFNPLSFIFTSLNELKIDDSDAEGDAVAAVEPDRINLMTVHASKGLEFKHVCLTSMEKAPRITSSEDFTYDEIRGQWAMRLPWGEDQDMLQTLPEKAWLENFKQQEIKEHARVLYVALTRAEESVYMSWKGEAGKEHSWASMVRMDIAPGLHRTANYSYQVSVGEDFVANAVDVKKDDHAQVREPWMKSPQAEGALGRFAPTKMGQPLSVSDLLERKPGVKEHSVFTADISHRLQYAARGSAVHKLMELMKYPGHDRIRRLIERWFPNQEESVAEAIQFVRECAEPPLLEIIENGQVEWRFSFIEKGLIIDGQIDLWGRSSGQEGGVWIVDYKTGSSQHKEKAFEQMAIYSMGLRRSGLISLEEKLQMAAVYPFAREIYVRPAPDDEAVRAMLGI